MKNIYTITEEPQGVTYRQLIVYALRRCSSLTLVIRDTVSSESATEVLKKIEKYQIKKEQRSEWPGTKLIDHTATVFTYDTASGIGDTLHKLADRLYDWVQPSLPEDLCFSTKEDDPWLVTISHERDAYLNITEEEFNTLIAEVPALRLQKDQTI